MGYVRAGKLPSSESHEQLYPPVESSRRAPLATDEEKRSEQIFMGG